MAKKNVGKKALDENNLENVAGGRVYKNDDGTWKSEVIIYDKKKKGGGTFTGAGHADSERDAKMIDDLAKKVAKIEGFEVFR